MTFEEVSLVVVLEDTAGVEEPEGAEVAEEPAEDVEPGVETTVRGDVTGGVAMYVVWSAREGG